MTTLRTHLPGMLEDFAPDLVLYDAGCDVHVDDRLGKLCLTDEGIRQRDRHVFQTCVQYGIPVASVIGGGYSESKATLAARHAIVIRSATEIWQELNVGDMKWV